MFGLSHITFARTHHDFEHVLRAEDQLLFKLCRSNYKGEEIIPVFSFPSDEDTKNRWIKFVNRKD